MKRNFSVLCAPDDGQAPVGGGDAGLYGSGDQGSSTAAGAAASGDSDSGVASLGGADPVASPDGAAAAASGDGSQAAAAATPAAPAQPAVLRLDPETIAALRAQAAPPQQQAPQRLSQEALDKLLNPVRVNAELMKQLGFDAATPEQIKGFQLFADSISKNATSIAQLIVQQQVERFNQQLAPIMEFHQQEQIKRTENEFYTSYPNLKNYAPLVKAAARQISPTKADGSDKSVKEVFGEISEVVMQTLKASGINLPAGSANHSAGAGGQGGQQGQVPTANSVASPGRSATGGGGGKPNHPDASIYG